MKKEQKNKAVSFLGKMVIKLSVISTCALAGLGVFFVTQDAFLSMFVSALSTVFFVGLD